MSAIRKIPKMRLSTDTYDHNHYSYVWWLTPVGTALRKLLVWPRERRASWSHKVRCLQTTY